MKRLEQKTNCLKKPLTDFRINYHNSLKSRNGEYSETIGYDSVEDATDCAFNKTNGKIASVDIIDVEDEIIYSVENGVVVKETKKEELENYFNFVVCNN